MDPWVEVIDAWLLADREVPRKQRHTARRVWQRLVAEHGASVAEVTVSRYVARRRIELGLDRVEVAVPQTHPPGAEAEVDFGEFYATVAGGGDQAVDVRDAAVRTRARRSTSRSPPRRRRRSWKGTCWRSTHFGGVPGRIRYDNLKPAVMRVLRGRDRAESERFIALRSHYGFDSFFCLPGKEGAHEKGGVEGEIGRFRRRHLVPVPKVASLAELNELIAAGDLADDDRVITGRPVTVAAAFAAEQPHMMPLPARAVRRGPAARGSGRHPGPGVVRQCYYSVPARYAGRRLPVRLSATSGRGPATGRASWPGTSGRPASTPRSSSWTTTWRCSRSNPARCPARPRWRRPGQRRVHRRPPAVLGRRPPRAATRPAPGR